MSNEMPNEMKCEWCQRVFAKPQGLSTHKNFCSARPSSLPKPALVGPDEETVWARRLKVFDLRMRGTPIVDVSSSLRIPVRTIFSDMEAISDDALQRLHGTPRAALVVSELLKAEFMLEEIGRQFFSTPASEKAAKAGFARIWLDLWRTITGRMEDFGVLPRRATELEVYTAGGRDLSLMSVAELVEEQARLVEEMINLRQRANRPDQGTAPAA